jgi:hypothetical protein
VNFIVKEREFIRQQRFSAMQMHSGARHFASRALHSPFHDVQSELRRLKVLPRGTD